MFQTGIFAIVRGNTASDAINKYSPDGTLLVEFTLGVGGGNAKYPVIWVHVTVWEKLAEETLKSFAERRDTILRPYHYILIGI